MTMLSFGRTAPIKRRVVAYIIDALIAAVLPVIGIIVAVTLMVGAMGGEDPSAGILTVAFVVMPIVGLLTFVWMLVYTAMQSGSGSIGMRAQGLRLGAASDGAPVGFWKALLRNVVFGVTGSIVVGCFSPLFDGSGRFQGWHDKAAGTVMLDQRSYSGGAVPQPLNAAQPHLVPDLGPAPALPPTGASMPGFAAPTPQTSMPGFAQPPSGFAPQPNPVVAAPSLPVQADAILQPSAEEEFDEHTVLSPHLERGLPDDPLISFVPGVTQEPVRRPMPPVQAPEPVAPEPVAPEPVARESVGQPLAPESPPARVTPTAPVPVHAEPDAPAAAPLAPLTVSDPAPASAASASSVSARLAPPVEADHEVFEAEDIESTRISVPGHRLVFTWDDGQRATVSGRTVFGRNPEEPDGATNIAVRDETRSLSKTHFEAGANARGGWVMDRQSTNGTMIVREGARIACPPGQRVPVRLGDVLEIGDRIVTIGGYV